MSFTEEQASRFKDQGYAVIEDFITEDQCDVLRNKCSHIIANEDFTNHPTVTFSTEEQTQARKEYFLTSGDKVRFFFEEGAVNSEGQVTVPYPQAINKIGHALHVFVDEFKVVTFCEKIHSIARALKMKNPVVPQSMYIFKQPHFGGSVLPHQDSSFLYNTPNSLIGFWIALEDAKIENSCLWFVPKSHQNEPKMRLVRKVENGVLLTEVQGTVETPYGEGDYVACPVKKGSLVLIHGHVWHKSEPNTSNNSRHVYTFHMYDKGTSEWSDKNWLQPSEEVPFTPLYS